jgi:hypothetical protein
MHRVDLLGQPQGLEQLTTSFHAFTVWLTTEAAAIGVAALALILGGGMVLAGVLGRGSSSSDV